MLQFFQGLEKEASRGPSKEKGGMREKEQGGREEGWWSECYTLTEKYVTISECVYMQLDAASGARRVAT